MGNEQYLTTELEPKTRVLTITLNRQNNARNPIGTDTILALKELLEPHLLDPQLRGVILISANTKAFSVGADVEGELKSLNSVEAARFSRAGGEVFTLFSRLPCVTVAALAGFALGGGLELAMCCDFRIAAKNVRLGLPEINLGVIPGWGGTQRLPRLIGRSRALRAILSGDPLNAATALDCGLVDELVEAPDKLLPAARKLLAKFADKSPRAVALAKRAVYEGGNLPLSEALLLESNLFAVAWSTADREEGVSALLEKRRPRWPE